MDERAELELLRKKKRLRELEARAGASQQPESVDIQPVSPAPQEPQASTASPEQQNAVTEPESADPAWWDPRPRTPTESASTLTMGPLGPLAQRGMKAGIGFAQEKLGRPAAEAIYSGLDKIEQSPIGSGESITGTRVEPELRAALSVLGGEGFKKGSAAGEQALERDLGKLPGVGKSNWWSPSASTAASVVKGALESAPTMAATAGIQGPATKGAQVALSQIPKLAKFAPVLGRMLGGGAEAAAGGAFEGMLLASKDPLTEAGIQGVMGLAGMAAIEGAVGIGKGLVKSVNALRPSPRMVAALQPDIAKVLDEELVGLADTAVRKVDVSEPVHPRGDVAPSRVAQLDDATPTAIRVDKVSDLTPFKVVVDKDDTGKVVARVFEVRTDGSVRVGEMPLSTAEERAAAHAFIRKSGNPSVGSSVRASNADEYFDFLHEGVEKSDASWKTMEPVPPGRSTETVRTRTPVSEAPKHNPWANGRWNPPPPNPDIPSIAPTPATKVLSDGVHLSTQKIPYVQDVNAQPGTAITRYGSDVSNPPGGGRSATQILDEVLPPSNSRGGGSSLAYPMDTESSMGIPPELVQRPYTPAPWEQQLGPQALPPASNGYSPGDAADVLEPALQYDKIGRPLMGLTGGNSARVVEGNVMGGGRQSPAIPSKPPLGLPPGGPPNIPPGGMPPAGNPPPPPPPGPGDIDPLTVASMDVVQKSFDRMSRQPGLIDRFLKVWQAAHNRGPVDIGHYVLNRPIVASLEETERHIREHLNELIPRKMRGQFGKDFTRYAEGDALAAADLEKKYPQVWARFKHDADKLLAERDELQHQITDLGGIPDDLTDLIDAGIMTKYLAKRYMAYVLPRGEWANVVKRSRRDLIANAANHLHKELPTWSEDDLAAALVRILKAEDPLETYKGFALGNLKSATNLLARKEIAPPIRALLGEVENGIFKLSHSLGAQRAIKHNLETWAEISGRAEIFSPQARADLHPMPIPDSKRLYGRAAGGYTTPDIYENLINLPNAPDTGYRWHRAINSFVKANQVLAPTAFLNATIGNGWYSVLAGGLDWMRPRKSGQAFLTAARELYNYSKNPKNALILEARRMGVDAPGFGGREIGAGVDGLVNELMGDMLKQSGQQSNLIDITRRLGNSLSRLHKTGYAKVGAAYDLIDRTYKLANYVAVRDKLLAKGTVLQDAQRMAARKVNQSFPAYDKMSPAGRALVGGPVGLVARYGSFFAENLRVHAALPGRLVSEADLAPRLVGWGIVGASMFGAGGWARREIAGISDDEVAAAEASISKSKQYYRPLTFTMPWRDEKGRPEIWDATQWFPIASLLQGDETVDPWYRRTLGNIALGPTSGGFAEDAFAQEIERTGLMRQRGAPKDLLPGESGAVSTIQKLWDYGGGPRAISSTYDAVRRTGALGELRPTEEALTPRQAAMKIAGFPIVSGVTPGGPQFLGAKKENIAQQMQIQDQLRRLKRTPLDLSQGMIKEIEMKLEGLPPQERRNQDVLYLKQELQKLKLQLQERKQLIQKGKPK